MPERLDFESDTESNSKMLRGLFVQKMNDDIKILTETEYPEFKEIFEISNQIHQITAKLEQIPEEDTERDAERAQLTIERNTLLNRLVKISEDDVIQPNQSNPRYVEYNEKVSEIKEQMLRKIPPHEDIIRNT